VRRCDSGEPIVAQAPKINAASRTLRGRTVDELSEGDILRKQAVQDALKMRHEHEEQQLYTFKPVIHAYQNVQSKLQIASHPSSYLKRLESETRLQHKACPFSSSPTHGAHDTVCVGWSRARTEPTRCACRCRARLCVSGPTASLRSVPSSL
jgi:hypothetical protein